EGGVYPEWASHNARSRCLRGQQSSRFWRTCREGHGFVQASPGRVGRGGQVQRSSPEEIAGCLSEAEVCRLLARCRRSTVTRSPRSHGSPLCQLRRLPVLLSLTRVRLVFR